MTDGVACSLALLVASGTTANARGVQCVPKRAEPFVIEHVPAETRRDPRFTGVSMPLIVHDLPFVDVVDQWTHARGSFHWAGRAAHWTG